jgi:hypothetical protein
VKNVATLEGRSGTLEQPATPESRVESRSRAPSIARRLGIIALSLVAGVLVGFWVYAGSHTNLDRSREADSARWQGQADLYLGERALDRSREADSARWQGQADLYLGERALDRSREADSARWQGQADYLGERVVDRSREADSARWQGQADYLDEQAPNHAGGGGR